MANIYRKNRKGKSPIEGGYLEYRHVLIFTVIIVQSRSKIKLIENNGLM